MPILKGKWYFKEVLTMPESDITFQAQGASFLVAGTTAKQAISIQSADNNVTFYDDLDNWSGGWYVYQQGSWGERSEARNITISQPMEVSEEFYNWFTKNAVDLRPTGTWRFNKTLTNPPVTDGESYVTTYYKGADDELNDYEIPFCTIHGINVDAYKLTVDWYDYGYYCIQAGTGLTKFLYKASEQTWTSEEAREITFNNNLEYLDPDFALWFYENAHSMELKLYSECYIAETADKIRACTNDNTLTFKVSDLADGVQTAYDAGYSRGMAEGGGYDTPTVTLTINRTGADDTSLLISKIYYTAYEDGAFKLKTFSNLYSSGGSVTLSSIVREAHIVIDGGSGTMTSISSPMSPMFTPYIASSLLLGRVAILSINNDCPANVTLTING